MKQLTIIHPNQSSESDDPHGHIYDWLEDEEDCFLSENIEQFVWQESGK